MSDDLLPEQLYALKSDPENFLSEFGTSQYFKLSGKTFEWKACKYDSDLNNNNGLTIGVRCLELDFNIELPIWTQGLGTKNKLYPDKGTPVSIWDVWHISEVIVFGDNFPLVRDLITPSRVSLNRSYFYGDSNTLNSSYAVSITQRLLFPRKTQRSFQNRKYRFKRVSWLPQCFTDQIDIISKKIATIPFPKEFTQLEGLGLWRPTRIDEAIADHVDLNQYDTQGQGAIHRCISKGDVERFEKVIVHGGDINMPTEFGNYTPLHWAVEAETKNYFLKRLLEIGANIECVETFRNRSPLGHAVRMGNLSAVKQLVEAGASVKLNPITKKSPLDIAFEKDQMPIIEYLASFREARNRSWSRRLIFAVEQLKLDQVEWLLSRGANPQTKNEKGQTPSDLVWEKLNHPWMVSKRGRFNQKKSSPCFQILGLLEGKKRPKGANQRSPAAKRGTNVALGPQPQTDKSAESAI